MNIYSNSVIIILAMIPSIILGYYVYKKDIVEKESPLLLLKLFICGILSAGIALFIEITEQDNLPILTQNTLFKGFLIVGLTEELTKWILNYFVCWKNKEFNYKYDAIVYSVFVSLGFATIENIATILSFDGNFLLIIQRGLITVPAHAFFAILSGYYLGKAKKYELRNWKRKKNNNLIKSIILPVLVHGLFDSLLFTSTSTTITMAILLIIYLYIASYIKIHEFSIEKKPIKKTD